MESDSWLSQGIIHYKKGDVKAFWLSKGYDFNIIAQMARDHMGVPANSAASERVFSNGGDIITKQRNKIGSSDTRYLLCLCQGARLAAPDVRSLFSHVHS